MLKFFNLFIILLLLASSCSKEKNNLTTLQVKEKKWTKMTFKRLDEENSGQDSLIIELNDNKSIKRIDAFHSETFEYREFHEIFYYTVPGIIDSSVISSYDGSEVFRHPVYYTYTDGKITNADEKDFRLTDYSYASDGTIQTIKSSDIMYVDTSIWVFNLSMQNKNLTNLTEDNIYGFYEKSVYQYDNMGNPGNLLFKTTGYPIFHDKELNSFFPILTYFSANNPVWMTDRLKLHYSYQYDTDGYPVLITCNWEYYSMQIRYE